MGSIFPRAAGALAATGLAILAGFGAGAVGGPADRRCHQRVALPRAPAATVLEGLTALFTAAYRGIFGLHFDDRPIEIVNWKVEATGPVPGRDSPYRLRHAGHADRAVTGSREVFFPDAERFMSCMVYNRYALTPGATIAGPALVEETESTCVIDPGDSGSIDQAGNLVIDIGASA